MRSTKIMAPLLKGVDDPTQAAYACAAVVAAGSGTEIKAGQARRTTRRRRAPARASWTWVQA